MDHVLDISRYVSVSMVRSLIYQLYDSQPAMQSRFQALYASMDMGKSQPEIGTLENAFYRMIGLTDNVWIVMDALDECSDRKGSSAGGLFKFIETLQQQQQSQTLHTSHVTLYITNTFNFFISCKKNNTRKNGFLQDYRYLHHHYYRPSPDGSRPQAIIAAIVGGVVGSTIPAGTIMCSHYCPGPKRHIMCIMSRDLPPGVSQESVDQCTGQINDQAATGVTVTLTNVDKGSK